MENLIFTQLSIPEVRVLFRQELEAYFSVKKLANLTDKEIDNILTVSQAANFLNVSIPTIYGWVHKGIIPHMKPGGKKIYFSKDTLLEWVKNSKKKTVAELQYEANELLSKRK